MALASDGVVLHHALAPRSRRTGLAGSTPACAADASNSPHRDAGPDIGGVQGSGGQARPLGPEQQRYPAGVPGVDSLNVGVAAGIAFWVLGRAGPRQM
jgi:hypothetical protein